MLATPLFVMINSIFNTARRLRSSILDIDLFKRDFYYRIREGRGLEIRLCPGHALPIYQKRNLNYDRFLPHLVSFIAEPKCVVVDVGANCGDSLAAMAFKNSSLKYLCIEADQYFYGYLLHNIDVIHGAITHLKVYPVLSFLGVDISPVHMEGRHGTKHAVLASGNAEIYSETAIPTLSLSSIIASSPICSDDKVRLIKTDTDGYDYDALNASFDVIKIFKPIIYFECQFEAKKQLDGYKNTLSHLFAQGYMYGAIFDNFGGLILSFAGEKSLSLVFGLIGYLQKQNERLSTRTIYYYDILLSTQADHSLIDEAICSYYN